MILLKEGEIDIFQSFCKKFIHPDLDYSNPHFFLQKSREHIPPEILRDTKKKVHVILGISPFGEMPESRSPVLDNIMKNFDKNFQPMPEKLRKQVISLLSSFEASSVIKDDEDKKKASKDLREIYKIFKLPIPNPHGKHI